MQVSQQMRYYKEAFSKTWLPITKIHKEEEKAKTRQDNFEGKQLRDSHPQYIKMFYKTIVS